jgi:enoyl-CoA hydratase/carnithine racemase
MKLKNIIVEKRGHVGIAFINHPPANAWNLATIEDFKKAIDELEHDREIRVVIITGQGEKCFSAGLDLSDSANAPKSSPMARALWKQIDQLEKPTIAAVNGHAIGGGLELALCCHFRIMTDNPKAKLGLTELNVGIIPGWGGTQRLARVVGKAKAIDMIMFSKLVTAEEAMEMGLVNQVAPAGKLLDIAVEFANQLAERPPVAVKWVLRSITAGEYEGLDRGLEVESDGSAACRDTKDRDEGFKAFLEKRKPVFIGE